MAASSTLPFPRFHIGCRLKNIPLACEPAPLQSRLSRGTEFINSLDAGRVSIRRNSHSWKTEPTQWLGLWLPVCPAAPRPLLARRRPPLTPCQETQCHMAPQAALLGYDAPLTAYYPDTSFQLPARHSPPVTLLSGPNSPTCPEPSDTLRSS